VAAEVGAHAEAAGHWPTGAVNWRGPAWHFFRSLHRDHFLRKREPRKLEQPLWR
jgi:hypothetical protein